ncbi:hypothetical protein P167DRAFT_130972 [Morchella conica CCBAS932]|uniref:Uncharacterized protein n=1 Tax=Morchella conica CCBAS932 TaxID=1392247 RepID=A0A3N4KRI5_9PEZI|nr:hypothetical protein P167DRAFT_130972 [Morchella conica CCBAS932]
MDILGGKKKFKTCEVKLFSNYYQPGKEGILVGSKRGSCLMNNFFFHGSGGKGGASYSFFFFSFSVFCYLCAFCLFYSPPGGYLQ